MQNRVNRRITLLLELRISGRKVVVFRPGLGGYSSVAEKHGLHLCFKWKNCQLHIWKYFIKA